MPIKPKCVYATDQGGVGWGGSGGSGGEAGLGEGTLGKAWGQI